MNSWQAPVAGEPSLGTMHEHYADLAIESTPSATAYYTIDVSGEVPVGTMCIYIRILHSSAAVSRALVAFTDDTPTPAVGPVVARQQVVGITCDGTGWVRLTSSRTFVLYTTAILASASGYMFFYTS